MLLCRRLKGRTPHHPRLPVPASEPTASNASFPRPYPRPFALETVKLAVKTACRFRGNSPHLVERVPPASETPSLHPRCRRTGHEDSHHMDVFACALPYGRQSTADSRWRDPTHFPVSPEDANGARSNHRTPRMQGWGRDRALD
jgi:hypothetical protein